MTTARRAARATSQPLPDDGKPPHELYDADAPVWHDQAAYWAYMEARGWELPCSERFDVPTHPANRRNSASEAWGREHGVTIKGSPDFADWHRLRDLGLIGDGAT